MSHEPSLGGEGRLTDPATGKPPTGRAEALRERIAEALYRNDVARGGMAECDRERSWPLYLADADTVLAAMEPLARQVEEQRAEAATLRARWREGVQHGNQQADDLRTLRADRDALARQVETLTTRLADSQALWDARTDVIAERDALARQVERVEALCDEADAAALAPEVYDPTWRYQAPTVPASDIRAALAFW